MTAIKRITGANFSESSLDGFIRTQPVTEVYVRRADGEYRLEEHPFTDDWSPERKREKAREILGDNHITYGAFDGERVIGFIMLEKRLNGGRIIASSLHVSQEYRSRGIGRRLFNEALAEGRRMGAGKLYVSSCNSKETVGFYRSVGCVFAESVIRELAEDEPDDLQLECAIE